MKVNRISYRTLHPAIGAEVLDLDLSAPLDSETVAEIVDLWEETSVLIFRSQHLSPEEQLHVTGYFGKPRVPEHHKRLAEFAKDKPERQAGMTSIPGMSLLSNVLVDGKPIGAASDGELWFHSDQCYLEESAKASLLYAIEPTEEGGETCWASGYAAYAALPPEIKEQLDGVMAEYVLDYSTATNMQRRPKELGPESFSACHPAVVLHPATKRPSLFVNRQTTERLIGWDRGESDRLLEYLFDFQEQPHFIYEHKWRPGDLAVWDNRSCLHARKDFDPSQRRTMRRSTAGSTKLAPAKLQTATA